MNSFISWIGGKKLLRSRILDEFPDKGTYDRYIEVFGGAGWVLFGTDRHAELEVYNDINGNLVNLFKCVKDVKGLTDIQKAARFYILVKPKIPNNFIHW